MKPDGSARASHRRDDMQPILQAPVLDERMQAQPARCADATAYRNHCLRVFNYYCWLRTPDEGGSVMLRWRWPSTTSASGPMAPSTISRLRCAACNDQSRRRRRSSMRM